MTIVDKKDLPTFTEADGAPRGRRRVANPTGQRLRVTADGRYLEDPDTGVRVSRAEFRAMADGWIEDGRRALRDAEDAARAAKSDMESAGVVALHEAIVEEMRASLENVRAFARRQLAKFGTRRESGSKVDWARARAHPIAELVEVRRDGFARCPAHGDRTPSMKVYADNHAHCFSCGFHGSAIDVAAAVWNVSVAEAAARLGGR